MYQERLLAFTVVYNHQVADVSIYNTMYMSCNNYNELTLLGTILFELQSCSYVTQ